MAVCARELAFLTRTREQIEASKADLAETLSPQQRLEAERKAAEWLSSSKKRSGFAEVANPLCTSAARWKPYGRRTQVC
jgi:hypothetical protein